MKLERQGSFELRSERGEEASRKVWDSSVETGRQNHQYEGSELRMSLATFEPKRRPLWLGLSEQRGKLYKMRSEMV